MPLTHPPRVAAKNLNFSVAGESGTEMPETPNFQDSYIQALERLRDVLTPQGIQMSSVEKMELDRLRESDAMSAVMGMPAGSIAVVKVTLYVPLGG